MIRSYITIAIRSIKRNVSYVFLNIFGLTLGIAACLVIFLVVKNELSYDNYKKSDRIYRITLNALDFNSNISPAVAPKMRADFPELTVSQIYYQENALTKVDDKKFIEKQFIFADQYFTSIFDYEWKAGDPKTAFNEPNTVVLTETTAKKYFGSKDPMGQIINIGNTFDIKVVGVIKNTPANTSLPFGYLVSFKTIERRIGGDFNNFWNIGRGSYAYILLPEHYSIEKIRSRIPAFLHKNWEKDVAVDVKLPLQPLRDVHFDQRYINNWVTPTSRNTYYALFGVALLIIITACINFINLATAQAIKRSKEVGVRKVLGAARSQLIKQFMGETTMLVLIALILGVLTAVLFLSNAATWFNIGIDANQLKEPLVIAWIMGLTIVVILLSGLYPSFVLSAFQPVKSLKSHNGGGVSKGFTLRKGLVIAQFAISQIMIVGTLVVAHQMDYFENQDLGFTKDAVISVEVRDMKHGEALRHEFAGMPGVKDITFSTGAPSYNSNFSGFSAPDFGIVKDDVTEIKSIDEKYIDFFGLKMLAGNKILKTGNDSSFNFIANETLIHKLGIQEPGKAIGKRISIWGANATITGVVKDFASESKHKKIRPCVMVYNAKNFYVASLKLNAVGMSGTIDKIGKAWSREFPESLFKYEFLDDHIASLYTQEQKVFTAFKLFAGIAILIGCLGLYGLIAFAASQRTKEIGIRKVLGAPLGSIIGLFSKEFVWLISIAFLIAAPLGYYIMHNWLQNYAYHINIGAGLFVISIAASVVIAAITISYQVITAALVNPVKSLRSE